MTYYGHIRPFSMKGVTYMVKVAVIIDGNSVLSSLSGIIDTFAMANLLWQQSHPDNQEPLFVTETVTRDGNPALCYGTITIPADKSIYDIGQSEIVLLPAIISPHGSLLKAYKDIGAWLNIQYEKGAWIGAACTGTFILAESGLLDGRTATTNWQFAELFRRRYPQITLKPQSILTCDKNVLCTGAATAVYDMCLYCIERFGSKKLAIDCAKRLLIEPARTCQSPYMIFDFQKNHSDKAIMNVQNWLEENLNRNITIDSLANHFGFSPRNFKRRFKNATGDSPINYLQRLRIETAKNRLEMTRDTVNEITWSVGYEDSSSFRKLFKTHTGLSPSQYRDSFSMISPRYDNDE